MLATFIMEDVMAKLSEAEKAHLPASAFAFPEKRKEPLLDAEHVQNAIARFDQVQGVTDQERDAAWERIQQAARKFDVELEEANWRELFHKKK